MGKNCSFFLDASVRTTTTSFSPTRSAPVSSVLLDLGQPCLRPRVDADPHQSPIRIKARVLYAQCLKHGPWSAKRTPENRRYHAVSNWMYYKSCGF
jgi:hypothetical protein